VPACLCGCSSQATVSISALDFSETRACRHERRARQVAGVALTRLRWSDLVGVFLVIFPGL
jgi:hypothetical protein